MPSLMKAPPKSSVEEVTDLLHGVPVRDPYRWLEDQDSVRTRTWISEQTHYARSYLDNIPGRARVRERIREFLEVDTYDSLQQTANRYVFRKRIANQEQPCICMREGPDGEDQVLVDPSARGTGKYTAVRPYCLSADARLLLYEVKEGGERTGLFELLEIQTRKRLNDFLPRGYLRGFAFAPDGRSFCYVHEAIGDKHALRRAAYRHVLGTSPREDQEIFFAGEQEKLRLSLLSDHQQLVFLVYRFLEKKLVDAYLKSFDGDMAPAPIFRGIDDFLSLRLVDGKLFALTDGGAPNRRIVEVHHGERGQHKCTDIVREADLPIIGWQVVGDSLFVTYAGNMNPHIRIFDLTGRILGELPTDPGTSFRILAGSPASDDFFVETESFTEPVEVFLHSARTGNRAVWCKREIQFDSANYGYSQTSFLSKDGTRIPMYLVGRKDVLENTGNPVIMTAYGGFGVSMTPRFSVLVAFLVERGCLFALPNIRGGSEFGQQWHSAAKRRNRQKAYDDFLCAAEFLISSGRAAPGRLAIFGGSNSGLLAGVALTQRPDLFRAVVCMVPMLDMLRYHLFDHAYRWQDEFGTAEDPEDFAVLGKYFPYHQVRNGVAYPATMIVSGDLDQNCNPLHARKMTARLQAANRSDHPIILDYSRYRGHSPVLPLSKRIEALTDRLAFLCDQLQLME